MKVLHVLTLLASIYLVSAPTPVRAAESYDNCAGFITTVPTTISTQGTWCLSQDVSTAITSGAAVTINTNNVTLDCNHFKLGGLAAGVGTSADGVLASARIGVTVRNCNIRGFQYGVQFSGGASHVAEDNAFYGNTYAGVSASSVDGVVIRDNIFVDTGGSTVLDFPNPIEFLNSSSAIASGNIISGVVVDLATFPNSPAVGIYANSQGTVVSGNRISAVTANGSGTATGIHLGAYAKSVDNIVDNVVGASARGLSCVSTSYARGTVTSRSDNFSIGTCLDGGGNLNIL